MKREKLVRAFGYGVKKANFHNRYGDSYVLVALRTRDENNNLTFSTIKSNGGGSKTRYVRFLTKSDALKFIQEKLTGDAYVPYLCKTERVLSLEDPEYGLYLPATEIPSNLLSPAKYDANGKKISNAQYTDSLTIDSVVDALNLYPDTFGDNQKGSRISDGVRWDYSKKFETIFDARLNLKDTGDALSSNLFSIYYNAVKSSDSSIRFDFYLNFNVHLGWYITPRGVTLHDWYNVKNKTHESVTYVDPKGKVLNGVDAIWDAYNGWDGWVKFSIDVSFPELLQGIETNMDAKNTYLDTPKRVQEAASKALVPFLLNSFAEDNSWVDKADKSFTDHFVALMKLLDTWYDEEYVDVDL